MKIIFSQTKGQPYANKVNGASVSSWVQLILLSIIWGGAFFLIELALRGISPGWLVAARMGAAAAFMCLLWAYHGFTLQTGSTRNWMGLALLGVLNTSIPFFLLSWGQQHVSSSVAGVSMASAGLIALPLSHYFVPDEIVTKQKVMGFSVGFLGILLLFNIGKSASLGSSVELAGLVACLFAASCYAMSSVLLKNLSMYHPVGLSALSMLVGALVSFLIALGLEGAPPPVSNETVGVLLVLGIVPTALANLIRIRIIRDEGPVFLSNVSYLCPAWAVVFGALFLKDEISASLIGGLVMILSGVAISQAGHRPIKSLKFNFLCRERLQASKLPKFSSSKSEA
jgi:drug/metabolite transporter (DMT)-like permease